MKKLFILMMIFALLISGCKFKPRAISFEDNIYFIMIDRFNDADENLPDVNKDDPKAYQGGDIRGIIQKLDYIKALGMTSIWLTPVMDNAPRGYHGYWVHDFYSVDEHFGTMDDLRELVDEAHKRDIKVILDYIVNHMGEGTPWLDDPDKDDWFHENSPITNWSDKKQLQNGWIYGLPDLNHENPEVRDYLIENAKWWINETGIDGFRLDTVRHVPDDFWALFIDEIKDDFPDFYILGEVWNNNARILKVFQNLGMDGITNYSLYKGIADAFGPYGNMNDFSKILRDESVFTDPTLNSIFIDNHDNPRFYDSSEEYSKEYTEQALTFMYTYPAVSTLYYGTESLLEGDHDPVNRKFMQWSEEGGLVSFIKGLTEIKSKYLESFEVIAYERKSFVYKISRGSSGLLVAMNTDATESSIDIPFTGSLRNYYTNETIESNGIVRLEMEPVSTSIFIIE